MSMSPTDFSHCSSEGEQNLSWNILVLSVVVQCTANILLHNIILAACLGWIFDGGHLH